MKKKFDKNIFGLLSNRAFHSIISIYMNTFLVAYLLNINEGNFFNVAQYYVISYLVMIVFYIIASYLLCKINKLLLLRISIGLSCIILAYMSIIGDNIANHILIVSSIYNASNGLYWASLHATTNETVKGKKLQSYNTYDMVVSNMISIIIPVALGSIIDNSSLYVASTFIVIVGLLEVVSTLFVKKPQLVHPKLDFKGYYRDCYNGSHKRCFKLLCFGYLTNGCKDAITTLVTMLIVLTFKTNTSLGIISSLISILTILVLLLFNRNKQSGRGNSFIYVALACVFSMLLLIIDINKPTIVLFNFCYASLLSIINRSYAVKRSGIIRAIDKKQYIIEHQAVMETVLNIGRIIFYSILLLASFSSEIWVYKMLIAVGMSFVALYGVSAYLLEKEYEKILIEREFKKQLQVNTNEVDSLIPCYSNPNNETILK